MKSLANRNRVRTLTYNKEIKVMKNTLKIIVGSLLVISIIGGLIAILWIVAILQGNI
jgi:hypothetical protein